MKRISKTMNFILRWAILVILPCSPVRLAAAQELPPRDQVVPVDHMAHLPPVPTWSGQSENLMLSPGHDWATDFEQSGGIESPDYDRTVEYLRRLTDASPELRMVSLGESPQGRQIWAVLASGEGAFSAQELRESSRPLLFAQSGIHAGEIDGKDAGLMLLRDMTVLGSKRHLLEGVNFAFVPILSVDGHERRGPYSRMNQRGPTTQGWRTSARNLNLNRDYVKAQTLEIQHILRALDAYDPDLYLDLHVTDGADYQYDITYGWNPAYGWSPSISAWLGGAYRGAVDAALEEMGHIPGPLIFPLDEIDITRGIGDAMAPPRFANGYGDVRHLPTVLVENHSLKPYRQRVLGNYVLLEATMRLLGEHFNELWAATRRDRDARPDSLHLSYSNPQTLDTIVLKGIHSEIVHSDISNRDEVRYTGSPVAVEVPIVGSRQRASVVSRPSAYWIPAEWNEFASLLELHGIPFERLERPRSLVVERYRLLDAAPEGGVFEGRARVRSGQPIVERDTVSFGTGSLRVPTDHPRGTLAMILLEPESPDGLFQWGFLLEILQRTEYFERYMMEPMAREMMERDPSLKAEFLRRVETDPEFAASSDARLTFFYERTPYYDRAWKLYPIAREP